MPMRSTAWPLQANPSQSRCRPDGSFNVRVGSANATITAKSAIQLVFVVPSGIACGAIALESASQAAVAGGSVVVGSGCVATVAASSSRRCCPRVRAMRACASFQARNVGPHVRRRVTDGSAGPARAPDRLQRRCDPGHDDDGRPTTLTGRQWRHRAGRVRYSEAQSFNVELPGTWVRSDFRCASKWIRCASWVHRSVVDATPAVGLGSAHGDRAGPRSSRAALCRRCRPPGSARRDLARFPIPAANITVTVRQPYTLTSVVDGLDTSTEWQNALSELNQLRAMEAGSNTRFYFGFVRRSGGGIAGIGYVPGRTALGWDSSTGWQRTMSHELGHNLSRPHAPCGGVAAPGSELSVCRWSAKCKLR